MLDSFKKKHKLKVSAVDADAIKRRRGRLVVGSKEQNSIMRGFTNQ
jgi:hypothetical protein